MRRFYAILLVVLLLAAYGVVGRIEADSQNIMTDTDMRIARQNIMAAQGR